MLCLGPADGDAAKIISKLGIGTTLDYNDRNEIEKYISEIISNPVNLNIDPSDFSRRNLTKRLASLL